MRKVQKPSKPLDLPGSASRTPSLTKTKDRPRKPSQSIPELSHFYRTHKQQDDVYAQVEMFLVDVSFLDTKQMRSHMLTSFCQLHKNTFKNTCRHKKSLHHDMVCLNKLECLKNVETFQTPTFSPKTCCLRFPNKLCKRIHDVSLRFVGNSSSECLQTVAIFHHRETNQTKLLRSMSIKTPSSEVKKMNSTN